MEGIWVPTNYYLQIKPQIHQILEASEAMMDMQFDPSQSTRTFVLLSDDRNLCRDFRCTAEND